MSSVTVTLRWPWEPEQPGADVQRIVLTWADEDTEEDDEDGSLRERG